MCSQCAASLRTAIDRWGYLWSGGGTLGRHNILIRMDTNASNAGMGVQIFHVPHETNVSTDSLSPLFPAPDHSLQIKHLFPTMHTRNRQPVAAAKTQAQRLLRYGS